MMSREPIREYMGVKTLNEISEIIISGKKLKGFPLLLISIFFLGFCLVKEY